MARVTVKVEDEHGRLVREYRGIEWQLLEPLLLRLDQGIDVASRVVAARSIVDDLVDLFTTPVGRPLSPRSRVNASRRRRNRR